MSEESALVRAEDFNPMVLFAGDGDALDQTMGYIREQVVGHVPNLETQAGRKEIASLARKVASSKVVLDGLGKDLVAEWKAKSKKVDAERKRCRDTLDALRDEVRRPLTEWEEAEEARKQAELAAAAEAHRLKLEAEERERQEREAELARREAELAAREQEMQRKAEAEQAAKAQAEREARIAAEAEERAKAKAEAEAQARIAAAEAEAKRLADEARAKEEAERREMQAREEEARRLAADAAWREGCVGEVAEAIRALATDDPIVIAGAIADGAIPRVSMSLAK
jgi:chromosome segregation ATPase